MLGDIMLLCLRCERFDRALDVLTKLEKDQNNIVGVPNFEALQLFTDMCISRNKITEALVSFNIISLKYCSCLPGLRTIVPSLPLVSSVFAMILSSVKKSM
jgi:hypothetical protein